MKAADKSATFGLVKNYLTEAYRALFVDAKLRGDVLHDPPRRPSKRPAALRGADPASENHGEQN